MENRIGQAICRFVQSVREAGWHIPLAMAFVLCFALFQHIVVLDIPLSRMELRMIAVPLVVGAVFGYLIGTIRRLNRLREQSLKDMLRRDRQLEEALRKRDALRTSQERLQSALDGANDGLWDWNIESGEFYFSPRWYSVLGYAEGDIEPTLDGWVAIIHPDDVNHCRKTMQAHLEGKIPMFQVEHREMTGAGNYDWFLVRGSVVEHDADGRPSRVVGTHSNITERKKYENTLNSLVRGTSNVTGKDFYENLAQNLATSLGMKYALVGMLDTNTDQIRSLAVWNGDHMGRPVIYDLPNSPCAEAIKKGFCVIEDAVTEQYPKDKLLSELGARSYIGAPFTGPGGAAAGIVAVIDDRPLEPWVQQIAVTILDIFAARTSAEFLRYQTERKLREEKERIAVTLHAITDAVITTDAEGLITFMNPSATTLTGWDYIDAFGRPATDILRLVNGQTRETVPSPIMNCLSSREIENSRQPMLLVRRDDVEMAMDGTASPMRDEHGNIIGAVMVFRNAGHSAEMAGGVN